MEMSEKKGGGCALGGPAQPCVFPVWLTHAWHLQHPAHIPPMCLWKRAGARATPGHSLSPRPPEARSGGEDAPALPHRPQGGDVQPLFFSPPPKPSLSAPPPRADVTCMRVCVPKIMCLPLSCVPTGNSLPLECLTVRSMRKSAVSSLCLGTRCGYDEE